MPRAPARGGAVPVRAPRLPRALLRAVSPRARATAVRCSPQRRARRGHRARGVHPAPGRAGHRASARARFLAPRRFPRRVASRLVQDARGARGGDGAYARRGFRFRGGASRGRARAARRGGRAPRVHVAHRGHRCEAARGRRRAGIHHGRRRAGARRRRRRGAFSGGEPFFRPRGRRARFRRRRREARPGRRLGLRRGGPRVRAELVLERAEIRRIRRRSFGVSAAPRV